MKIKKYYDMEDPEIYDMANRHVPPVDPINREPLSNIEIRGLYMLLLNNGIKYGYIKKVDYED